MRPADRLAELGIVLPQPPAPAANHGAMTAGAAHLPMNALAAAEAQFEVAV